MEKKISEVVYVNVTNRNNGVTTYVLGDDSSRTFALNETKKIDIEELKALSAVPGGEYLLRNYLIVNDKSALDFLNIDPEPEYFYTETEIKELLMNGSMDQLEDCLNFAPNGVIELVKSIAVDMKLPDVRKRELIGRKTGFNVGNAIRVNEVLNEDNEKENETPVVQKRKAEPIKTEKNTTPVRKYNVVSQQ